MKLLMQQLNGAALASVWVFYEHLDKLPFINCQTDKGNIDDLATVHNLGACCFNLGTKTKQSDGPQRETEWRSQQDSLLALSDRPGPNEDPPIKLSKRVKARRSK